MRCKWNWNNENRRDRVIIEVLLWHFLENTKGNHTQKFKNLITQNLVPKFILVEHVHWRRILSMLLKCMRPVWRNSPTRARAAIFLMFLDHIKWHTRVGRTPLDEWSARRRDLYLTTHNIHKRETSILQAGFELAIPASDGSQTLSLDRWAKDVHIRIKFDLLRKIFIVIVIVRSFFWELFKK